MRKLSRPREEVENELLLKSYFSVRAYTQKLPNKKTTETKKANTLFDSQLF
jgi:hypothetical protein